MYIAEVPSRQNGKTYRAILLRESYREGGKVKTRTIANLSNAKPEEIAAIRYALAHKRLLAALEPRWETPVPSPLVAAAQSQRPRIEQGLSVGAVWCVYDVARRLGIEKALGTDRAGKLAMWQVAARVIDQGSRLSAVRLARTHAACDVLGIVRGFCEDDLYANLTWLAHHQTEIEDRLFETRRAGRKPELFLYDVTSSYLEGTQNALGDWGYNRDGKKGKMQIVIGMLCDELGDPVSVEVFEGNTQDVKTLGSQVRKTVERFGCERATLVGDRGMIKTAGIEQLHEAGLCFITAITKPQIETLLAQGALQMELFDESVCEVDSGATRYVLRRNPWRVEEMQQSRLSRRASVEKLVAAKNIYLREHGGAHVETAINQVRSKIQALRIDSWLSVQSEGRTLFLQTDESSMEKVSRLDGCYVLKSDLPIPAADARTLHDRYKDLALVEQAFRTCKTAHLEMRPVNVRTEDHTRAHALVVMLGYLIVRRLATAWVDMDLTVEEGLHQLSMLCSQTVQWPGQTVAVNLLPRPCETSRRLLEKAEVHLPEVLPNRGVPVGTRKRLPERRVKD